MLRYKVASWLNKAVGVLLAVFTTCALMGATAPSGKLRVAILPLTTPKNQPDLEQYGLGTMDTMIQTLSTMPQFVMIDRARIETILKEQQFVTTGNVDQKTAVAIGKLVGAQLLVTGNLIRAGDKIRITAHFTDMKTGQITRSEAVTGTLDNIFDLMDQLAQKFIAEQGVQVTAQQQERMQKVVKATANLNAYDFYLKGRRAYLLFTPAGYEEAIKHYQKAIEVDPQYALAYAGLGEAMYFWAWENKKMNKPYQDYYQQGYNYSQKALELNPNLPEAHRAYGRNSSSLGKGGYEQEVRKALELNANDAESWYALWYATGNSDNPDHEYIRKSIDLNPDLSAARYDRGLALRKQKRYEEAAVEYREAVRSSPNDADARYGLGNCYYDLKRYEEAVTEYREALRINPEYADAHYQIGNTLRRQERYDEALSAYREATRIDPQYGNAYYYIGIIYNRLKQPEKAMTALQKAAEINPKDPDVFINIGNIYLDRDELDQALVNYRKCIELKQDYANAYYNVGLVLARMGKNEAAAEAYELYLKYEPNADDAEQVRAKIKRLRSGA